MRLCREGRWKMKGLIKKYGHIWVLSFGLLYLVWFFYLEKTVTRQYHVMHVALDDYIPLMNILLFRICCGFSM